MTSMSGRNEPDVGRTRHLLTFERTRPFARLARSLTSLSPSLHVSSLPLALPLLSTEQYVSNALYAPFQRLTPP